MSRHRGVLCVAHLVWQLEEIAQRCSSAVVVVVPLDLAAEEDSIHEEHVSEPLGKRIVAERRPSMISLLSGPRHDSPPCFAAISSTRAVTAL